MEQEIIQPVDKELLKSELTADKQLRLTNKSNNEIYIVTAHNAPNVMREIGRLREMAFREAGLILMSLIPVRTVTNSL